MRWKLSPPMSLQASTTSDEFSQQDVSSSGKEQRLLLVTKMEDALSRRRRSWPPEVDPKEPVAGIFVPLDPDLSEAVLGPML